MVATDHREAVDRELTPAESLALIDSTLRTTRDALAFSEWPYYAIWGLAWGVAFTVTHLARSTVDAPLAQMPDGAVGAVWLVCVGAAIAATGVIVAHGSRGLAGTTARMGRRLGLSWFAAFAAAGPLGALLDLDEHEFGALFVFVVALLYLGQGAAFADDLQLGVDRPVPGSSHNIGWRGGGCQPACFDDANRAAGEVEEGDADVRVA